MGPHHTGTRQKSGSKDMKLLFLQVVVTSSTGPCVGSEHNRCSPSLMHQHKWNWVNQNIQPPFSIYLIFLLIVCFCFSFGLCLLMFSFALCTFAGWVPILDFYLQGFFSFFFPSAFISTWGRLKFLF